MRIYLSLLAACLFLAVVAAVAGHAQTQPTPKPFTKDDVVKLLAGNVPAKRVEVLVRERGIDFQITPEAESELRKAGATDPLLAALRDLAPKPPTLVVTTTPGGARVYIDDEFFDTTSSEGRLKLSKLAAGRHKLRVSADGYQNHEESIDLMPGKTLDVTATLKSKIPGAAPAGELAATASKASRASPSGSTLTFLGSLSLRFTLTTTAPVLPGKMTVGNGKLQFSSTDNKHSFTADLKDVVALNQYEAAVEFVARVSNKKVHHTFFVQMAEHNRGESTEQAAKELYEALKNGLNAPER